MAAEHLHLAHAQVQQRAADQHGEERGRQKADAAARPLLQKLQRAQAERERQKARAEAEGLHQATRQRFAERADPVLAAAQVVGKQRQRREQRERTANDAQDLVPPGQLAVRRCRRCGLRTHLVPVCRS
jgi:hypothetical protein